MRVLILTIAMVLSSMQALAAETPLKGKKVAVLCTMGVEKIELVAPVEALRAAGAVVHVVSPDGKPVRVLEWPEWAGELPVDKSLAQVKPADYDALYVPGGSMSPDLLILSPEALAFIAAFEKSHKPIASMCHGPAALIAAGVVKGKEVTAWPSLKINLQNAGAVWKDQEVVVSHNLITSRNPKDIPSLTRTMIKVWAR